MSDITMCSGEDCGIKEYCYRYTATPNEYRQAYFLEPPFKQKMDGTSCEYLMDNTGRRNKVSST